jgi:hypothetical protein
MFGAPTIAELEGEPGRPRRTAPSGGGRDTPN